MNQMKNTRSLKAQLQKSAYQAHGAAKTRHDRIGKLNQFNDYLKRNNIQITHIDQIKTRYIEAYIAERLAQHKNLRTLQNDMSAIRQTLRSASRDKLAGSARISNKALGLGGISRDGAHVAITDSLYQEIYQKALHKNSALAATIELARTFGLRGEEAVQSCQSLQTWQRALTNNADKLTVVFGTKGGRPRETAIIDRQRAKNAVNTALQIAQQQNGRLIDKPNLKQAMTYWRNQCRAIGLIGEISPHSLRYAFTHDAINHYRQQGFSEKEIYALTSMDLGHGDGRGRYIQQVYGQEQ